MSYNLFLDDFRSPSMAGLYGPVQDRPQYTNELWRIVRNYDEFVSYIIKYGVPKKVSFDHDLADEHYDPRNWQRTDVYTEKTGLDCANWLISYCMDNNLEFPEYYCHSMNPVGKERILNLLQAFENNY